MDKDDEFLHSVFTFTSQVCFEKAREHIEREREAYKQMPGAPWSCFLTHLLHLILAEKSYIDIGFLQNKNKGFLRKDNSLKSVYEQLKRDMKNIQDQCRQTTNDKRTANYCKNIIEYISARIYLIEFYERIYNAASAKTVKYDELQDGIRSLIEREMLCFTDITMTPLKAIFSLECEILEQLFSALVELQKLHFLPSLSLIYGAHTRLSAWESKMQNRESWKLGFLKNTPFPMLFQWLMKFKGAVVSKYSLYFHDTLAKQTSTNDLRQQCSKLQHDHYQKMSSFQRKYDATSVFLLRDGAVICDETQYENFPVIVSHPMKCPVHLETVQKMIHDVQNELEDATRIIYKYSTTEQSTFVLMTVENDVYLILIFESKKTEKDTYISNFMQDLCINLRCSKIFQSLKPTK